MIAGFRKLSRPVQCFKSNDKSAMNTREKIRRSRLQQPTKALGAPEAAKQKWEYKTETYLNEAGMNKLGAQGWELVSVSSDRDGNTKY